MTDLTRTPSERIRAVEAERRPTRREEAWDTLIVAVEAVLFLLIVVGVGLVAWGFLG